MERIPALTVLDKEQTHYNEQAVNRMEQAAKAIFDCGYKLKGIYNFMYAPIV